MQLAKAGVVLTALCIFATGMSVGGSEARDEMDGVASRLAESSLLKIELTLEGFVPLGIYIQGNASFSVVCEFRIGTDSHPTGIYWLAGDKYIDTKAAKACLAKWTLAGLEPNKKYVLVLNWEHNGGYVSLSILGDEMCLTYRDIKMLAHFVWTHEPSPQETDSR